MTSRYSTDIVIFGGGIAGLWLLKRLRQHGYDALLLESNEIGGGQTLASQGIIHGGLKYALSGSLTGAAQAIADMPARWRRCLAGDDEMDLSQVKLLSEHYYMWSGGGLRSKLKTFLGSKSLRGRIDAVAPQDYPEFFARATIAGSLYALPDFVVDAESLVSCLRQGEDTALFQIDANSIRFIHGQNNGIESVSVGHAGTQVELSAQRYIFAAGDGNSRLIEQSRLQQVKAQARPLNMVTVKSARLPSVYVHCVGDDFSLSPRLTVTTHTDSQGQTVWYLGGELAESGVGRSDDEQIEAAISMTAGLFPWVDFADAHWSCFEINRAEADVGNNYRPDDAALQQEGDILVAWPTKLTLAPSLADQTLAALEQSTIKPGSMADLSALRQILPEPPTAQVRWA